MEEIIHLNEPEIKRQFEVCCGKKQKKRWMQLSIPHEIEHRHRAN